MGPNGNRIGLPARILAESEETLYVSVTSQPSGGSGGGFGACGDGAGGKLPDGWHNVFFYDLEENSPSDYSSPALVDLDGDRIAYRRLDISRGYGSCNYVQSLNPTTRHRLIAYWLGVKVADMKWKPDEAENIVWTDQAAYENQLGQIVAAHHASLRRTAKELRDRGLLTADEAKWATPKLIVDITCAIDPCPF